MTDTYVLYDKKIAGSILYVSLFDFNAIVLRADYAYVSAMQMSFVYN